MDTLHHFPAYAGQLVLNSLLSVSGYMFQSTTTNVEAYKNHCSLTVTADYTGMPRLTVTMGLRCH